MPPTHTIPNLPDTVAFEILHTLRSSLPPPAEPDGSLDARIATAMAAVAAYHPADVSEALLAAQIVATDAHAMDCLRLALAPGEGAETTRHCRGQAAAMARVMQSGLRALQRTQAIRETAEAAMQPAAMQRAGYWFRDASVPEPSVPPTPAEPSRSPAAAPPAPAGRDEPARDATAEAELYAVIYPDRAALIRAHGGLPPRLNFGPPEPAIVAALVNAASPAPNPAAA